MPVVSELRAGIANAQRTADQAKAEVGAHERECVVRYDALKDKMTTMSEGISSVKTAVEAIKTSVEARTEQHQQRAWTLNWKAWAVVGAILTAMVSLIAWMAGQLYALEPLRIHEMAKSPPAVSASK